MELVSFAIVVLGALQGTKLIFLGTQLSLAGQTLVGFNLLVMGLVLIVLPVYILQWKS